MTGLRVRFAPSPTGQLHVGNARTALINWLLARGQNGVFILRIEDTDIERSTVESERAILDDLRWLGLDWQEGPDVGGPHTPYRQSERLDRYQAVARDLLARELAYYCFCTPAMLEAERTAALASGQPPGYSGRCRSIDRADAARRVGAGEAAAVRFAVPVDRPEVTFHDIVRGEVTFSRAVLSDFVVLRSDGRPAYNFSVVIDDVEMRVTHVVRGEDHISNTPRQVLIYEALRSAPPAFAHLPLVLGPDHSPLSKRHGATSVAEFRERGFLPEALVNYLALLGWSPGEGEEIVPLDEMARRFRLEAVSHSAGVFDPAKLAWINRHYMKESDPGRLTREASKYFTRAGFVSDATDTASTYLQSLLAMAIGSVDRLEEIPDAVELHLRLGGGSCGGAGARRTRRRPRGRGVRGCHRAGLAARPRALSRGGRARERDQRAERAIAAASDSRGVDGRGFGTGARSCGAGDRPRCDAAARLRRGVDHVLGRSGECCVEAGKVRN